MSHQPSTLVEHVGAQFRLSLLELPSPHWYMVVCSIIPQRLSHVGLPASSNAGQYSSIWGGGGVAGS